MELEFNKGEVILIEFNHRNKDQIFFISTIKRNEYSNEWIQYVYEVEYCKRDKKFYYFVSSCRVGIKLELDNNNNKYWIKERYNKTLYIHTTSGLMLDDNKIEIIEEDIKEVLEGMEEEVTVYCSKCDDWLVEIEEDVICEHVWWCEECIWWSTPDERCKHKRDEDEDE